MADNPTNTPANTNKKFVAKSEQSLQTIPEKVKETAMPKLANHKESPTISKKPWYKRKKPLIIITSVLVLLVLIALPFIITLQKAFVLKDRVQALKTQSQAAATALSSQDLPLAEAELKATKESLDQVNQTFQSLSFWQYSPFKAYYQDGERVIASAYAGIDAGETVVAAIQPYADILGLKGAGSFTGGTAEDRLVQLVGTLETLTPAFDTVQQKVSFIDQQLEAIDPSRYPIKINDQPASELITQAKDSIKDIDKTITTFKPIVAVLPEIMGAKAEKQYFVLFQNDAELRATGGFMTGYAIVTMKAGKVTPVKSDDMYDLDAKFKLKIAPPDVLKQYLLVTRLNLRDMNLSPDFKLSMDEFTQHYQSLNDEPDIDGVIAIDTKVLTDLLTVLGDVEVPGYGTYSAKIDERCNCPQVIYELEDIIGRPTPYLRSDRKAILGPMMQAILLKAYGSGNESWPALFQTLVTNLDEKHVLFYYFDEAIQQAFETTNYAGRIRSFDGDYLHVNDSNFGGAKSNLFINQEIEDQVTVSANQATHELTLVYKNPAKASNCNLEAGQLCLNGALGNWQRVYLPQGAKLIESSGYLEGSVKTYDEIDRSVIEGFFKLNPESQITLKLSYSVPLSQSTNYQLLIQKQPGTKNSPTSVTINNYPHVFDLSKDTTVSQDLE